MFGYKIFQFSHADVCLVSVGVGTA